MDVDNILKFELSLEKISAIAAAISFWERPDVKRKIRNGFNGVNDFYFDPEEEINLSTASSAQIIINDIFKWVDLLNYPEKLMHDIKILIVKIGRKIYFWMDYIVNNLKLDLRYAETIYWKPHGEIDEFKILKKWLENPNFLNGSNCNCSVRDGPSCMISKFALEDSVRRNITAVRSSIFPYLLDTHQIKIRNRYTPYAVIATHIIFCTSQNDTLEGEDLENFRTAPNQLPARDLFNICIANNLQFAARHFWDNLEMNEKKTLIISNALMYYRRRNCDSRKELTAKILLFFLGSLAEAEKMQFLMENFVLIFELLIDLWPYQELCEKLLDKVVDYIPECHQDLLELITSCLTRKRYTSTGVINQSFYNKTFQILLCRISHELKQNFFIDNNYYEIRDLYYVLNYDILCIVINDSYLKMHRCNILNVGLTHFKMSVLEGNFNGIEKFFKSLNLSEDEIKSLKKKLDFVKNFLTSGNIILADKHLKWQIDSAKERNDWKNQVDAVEIFSILIDKNLFKAANDFLMWKFDTDEERNEFKENFKSDEFLRNKIFEIWCSTYSERRTDLMINKCLGLLNLFFETEEDLLDFRNNRIIQDDLFIEKYWDALMYSKNLNNLHNFLRFCSYTLDDTEQKKRTIANNINSWIDVYALDKDKFELVNALLDWIFATEEEKENAVKKYMSSPSGIELCIEIFKNREKNYPDHIVTFFNTWIKPSFEFPKMRMHLNRYNKTFVRSDIISCIRLMLNKRKEHRVITREHLDALMSIWMH